MLASVGATFAEEDNGPALVDLFARTCALLPALPTDMERVASVVGFVGEDKAILAELERGPRIDILYSAKLMTQGEKVGMTAYFEGPADGPTVTCTLNAVGVSADALPGLIEKSLNAQGRTEKTADSNRLQLNWRVGAAESGDTLEASVRRDPPRRGSIQLTYRGGKR